MTFPYTIDVDGTPAPYLIQTLDVHTPSLVIDIKRGQYVVLNLYTSITSLRFKNWPTGFLTRVFLEVHRSGSFAITDWAGALWADGGEPTLSPIGDVDLFVFHTTNTSEVLYGTVVGQDYE